MRFFKAFLLLAGLASVSQAVIGPPGGAPIYNQNFLQPGATFYVPNGVVTNSLTLSYLMPGLCQTTNAQGKVINVSCGSGSSVSSLAVNWNGVPATSPTYALNGVSPIIITALGGGVTAQFSLDPASVTLQGQNVIKLTSTLQQGATLYVSSGTILNFLTQNLIASTATFQNGLISNGLIQGNAQLNVNGITTLFGPVVSANYGYQMPDGSVMISTSQFVWNGSYPQGATANISSMTVVTQLNLPYVSGGNILAVNSAGQVIGQAPTAATIAVSTGGVIVSSPTKQIDLNGVQFTGGLSGTTTQIALNPSSVTLQGNSISLAALSSSLSVGAISTAALSISTASISSQVSSNTASIAALVVSTTSLQTQINGKGIGTITGVTAGTNLTGGGISGAVTLNLASNVSISSLSVQGNLAIIPNGLPTNISTGTLNVYSTVNPLTLMNNSSSEANEANLASFRWVGNITGVTTQMVPLYCKLTNTSNGVNALADGVCMYAWARDVAGANANLQGAEARVTGSGVAKNYTGIKVLSQWISPDSAHDTIGTTSTVVGMEISNQMLKSDGLTPITTGTQIDLLIDANNGGGSPGHNWTIYSPSSDPSWMEGGLEIGTGGANQAASFIVAATTVTSTGPYAVIVGSAGFNTGIFPGQYFMTISTNGVVTFPKLTGGQFLKTNSTSSVVTTSLFADTNTWTAGQTFSSMTVNGTGPGQIGLIMNTTTFYVVSSSPTANNTTGDLLAFSGTTTIVDSGLSANSVLTTIKDFPVGLSTASVGALAASTLASTMTYTASETHTSSVTIATSISLGTGATMYLDAPNNLYWSSLKLNNNPYAYLNIPQKGYTPGLIIGGDSQISDTWDTSASSGTMFSTTLSQNYTLAQSTSGTAGQIFYGNLNGNYGWAFHAEMPNTSANDYGFVCSDHGANDACFVGKVDDTANTSQIMKVYTGGSTLNPNQRLIEIDAASDWHNQGANASGAFNGDFEYFTTSGANTAPVYTLDYMGREVINVSTGGAGTPAGSAFIDAGTSNMTVSVTSNSVFSAWYGVCQNTDTAGVWPGEVGHIPCNLSVAADVSKSQNVMYGQEGRVNAKGSAPLYGGDLGLATHLTTAGSSTTVMGLIARTEMRNADGTSVSVSSDDAIGLTIYQPVGTPNHGFAVVSMSTYPAAFGGNLYIGAVPSIPAGLAMTSWPGTSTANFFLSSQGNALPATNFTTGLIGSYWWSEYGRTGDDGDIVVPASANNFMVGTNAGDFGMRATNSTNKLVLGAGSGQGTLYVNRSSVTITGNTFAAPGQSAFTVLPSSAQGYGLAVSTTNGGPYIVDISTSGHLNAQTNTAPTTANCGTSPTVTARSSEIHGSVTLGSGSPLACSIVFAQPYNNAPDCFYTINSSTITVGNYGVSTTSATFSLSSAAGGFTAKYFCMGSD